MSASVPTDAAALPPLELFLRSTNEIRRGILSKDGKTLEITSTVQEKLKKVCISRSHDMLKLAQDGTLHLQYAEATSEAPVLIPISTSNCEFSPSGKYFSTWSKPDVLTLFRTEDAKQVFEVKTKTQTFHFPLKEEFVALQVGQEVRCWDLNTTEVCFKLKIDRLAGFSLCPQTPEICFAAFQLGTKSGPATVSLYEREKLVCSSQSFRAEEGQFKWSPFQPGDCLVKIETMVDATGKSYYGESRLVRLSLANKSAVVLDCNPVHDFEWSPRRYAFACVSSQTCQFFDGKTCEVLSDFKTTHKNVCSFSPSGRFIVFAGFGNLAGQMEFYDTKKCKLLGKGRAEAAVSYAWSPCGRMFITSTLMPRMNVDNGVSVFNYRGELIARWMANGQAMLGNSGLVEVKFMPTTVPFPDLPASPKLGPAAAPAASEMKKPVMSFTQARLEAKKALAQPAAVVAPPPPPPPAPPVVKEPEPEEEEEDPNADPAKMVRKLKKLLRQIEDIEAAGAKNAEQAQKLKKKQEVSKRIQKWEAKMQ